MKKEQMLNECVKKSWQTLSPKDFTKTLLELQEFKNEHPEKEDKVVIMTTEDFDGDHIITLARDCIKHLPRKQFKLSTEIPIWKGGLDYSKIKLGD